MEVQVYSDIACPWCYIGKKRFFDALAESGMEGNVVVSFRAFQLDPRLSDSPRPLKEHLEKKFGPRLDGILQEMEKKGEAEGLRFNFGKAKAVDTLEAHRLLWFAEREGGQEAQAALADRLFEAYFSEGKNIADKDVLAELAASAGLDRERAHAFLASEEGKPEVEEQIQQAYQFGIRAVPTFIFDGEFALQGAQPAEIFTRALQSLKKPKVDAPDNVRGAFRL